VEYYAGFLRALYKELNRRDRPGSSKFHVIGRSFAGFEAGPEQSPKQQPRYHLYDLTGQVDFAFEELRTYIDQALADKQESHADVPKIILAGHSFGTFALAEIMKRIHTEQSKEKFQIIGGILLFPPIADLDASPRGSKIAVSILVPFFFHDPVF
jgi:hypothetical protein